MTKEEKAILMELIFCINSPQTKYITNIKGEELLKLIDVLPSISVEELANIYKGRIRFHNNKARYCMAAYENFPQIFNIVTENMSTIKKREWLVKNIKGLSYKEASHFLRNIKQDNEEIAILDVHVLKYMNYPKTCISSRKEYLIVEQEFIERAKMLNVCPSILDIEIWEKYRTR